MLNSIGLKEGHEIREEQPKCSCQWVTLLCIPPIHRLEKKCNYCRDADNEPLLPEPEHVSIRLPEASSSIDTSKKLVHKENNIVWE